MICVWSAVIRHRIRLCTVLGLVMGLVKQLPLGPNGFSEDENACFSLFLAIGLLDQKWNYQWR